MTKVNTPPLSPMIIPKHQNSLNPHPLYNASSRASPPLKVKHIEVKPVLIRNEQNSESPHPLYSPSSRLSHITIVSREEGVPKAVSDSSLRIMNKGN